MVAEFKLKFEDLLRKHVDLRILFVDLFGQLLKLRRLTDSLIWRRRHCLPEAVKARERYEHERGNNAHGAQCHGTRILPLAGITGKRGRSFRDAACLYTISP